MIYLIGICLWLVFGVMIQDINFMGIRSSLNSMVLSQTEHDQLSLYYKRYYENKKRRFLMRAISAVIWPVTIHAWIVGVIRGIKEQQKER